MAQAIKTVFLSSTGRDLRDYREAVAAAITRMEGYKCVRMEDFGARDATPNDFDRQKVEGCDVFVCLIGHFYGEIPKGGKRSFTEREYDAAVKAGKPRLVFLASDDFSLPVKLTLAAAATAEQQDRFRARARKDRVAASFDFGPGTPQDLATKVVAALHTWEKDAKRPAARKRAAVAKAGSGATALAVEEEAYLTYFVDRYQYLDFKGMGVSDRATFRLPLLQMYVPLRARLALPEGETWSPELRLAGRRLSAEEQKEIGSVGAPQPVLEILQKESGLVLLGDPGAGKSTFLKILAVSLADPKARETLGLSDRIPFLVPISGYADAVSQKDVPLDTFLVQDFGDRVGGRPIGNLLKSALASGRALLLLDGLDEVRDRSLQRTVVDRIENFFSRHQRAGNKFVLTSRIVGYREVRPTAKGLVEATLVDFDDEEIEQYLGNWVQVQESAVLGDTQAAARSAERERQELLQAVRHNPAVRSLAANPLLLTILALMKRQGVTLPEQRAKLYSTYVRTLLETWNTVRSLSGRAVFERTSTQLLQILAPLALWMHEASPGIGLVQRRALRDRLEAIYRERNEPDPMTAAEAFLRDVGESSLLLERGHSQYGFIHLTFLEYLAGYALAKREQLGVDAVFAEIAPRVGEPAWREVLLLAIGHLGVVEEREISAGNLLLELIEKRPGPSGAAEALAGDALADLGAIGIRTEVREKVVAALLAGMRDDARVEPKRRAAVGFALARVGDPRPEATTLEGMQFCWVPPGPFLMGSEEPEENVILPESPEHEVDLGYGYWIGRFPVTVAQLGEYSRKTGTLPGHPYVLQGPTNTPVVVVTWYEAVGFCHWLTDVGRTLGWIPGDWRVELPSEAEWEKAARGGLQVSKEPEIAGWGGLAVAGGECLKNPQPDRRYPWGEEADSNRASYDETGIGAPSSVGCFRGGASPVGAEELSGNVWEWTRSLLRKGSKQPEFGYPYVASDGRESASVPEDASVVLRGASYLNYVGGARCASRDGLEPLARAVFFGFRLVVRPFFPDP